MRPEVRHHDLAGSGRWRPAGLAGLAAAVLLLAGGCASGPGAASSSAGCTVAPQPGPGQALPYNLVTASAVPGSRQAWVVAGRYSDAAELGGYLLHFTGRTWTRTATFGRNVQLQGVLADSASAAWVWGYESQGSYLALVSGGVIHQVRSGPLSGVAVSAMASAGRSAGKTVTWLAGGRGQRSVLGWWDGTSWHEVPWPAGAGRVFALSASGPSDAWMSVSGGWDTDPWLVHWNGRAWSKAYTPPARLAGNDRIPQGMPMASSPGNVWIAFAEGGSGGNGPTPPTRTYSAYLAGGTWRMVPVPGRAAGGLAAIVMSGRYAWAITADNNIEGVLYSYGGGAWCVQHLPHGRHPACMPTGISAASPGYVIAVTSLSGGTCHRSYAYIFDGRHWRSAAGQPAGGGPAG